MHHPENLIPSCYVRDGFIIITTLISYPVTSVLYMYISVMMSTADFRIYTCHLYISVTDYIFTRILSNKWTSRTGRCHHDNCVAIDGMAGCRHDNLWCCLWRQVGLITSTLDFSRKTSLSRDDGGITGDGISLQHHILVRALCEILFN